MAMDWVIKELATLALGDKRLNRRAQKILEKLSCNPTDSIPAACAGAAETKATYRFFDNDDVAPEKIHEAHFETTLERMSKHSVVLIPQDTTMLNFSRQNGREDIGPTTHDLCRGMYLHSAIAVTPENICLGVVSCKRWHREKLQGLNKKEHRKKNYETPLENKESYRWLENYRIVGELARKLPETMMVSMGDREADIYDIYREASEVFSENDSGAHYLIRAKYDRSISTADGKKDAGKIRSELMAKKRLARYPFRFGKHKKGNPEQHFFRFTHRKYLFLLQTNTKKEKTICQ